MRNFHRNLLSRLPLTLLLFATALGAFAKSPTPLAPATDGPGSSDVHSNQNLLSQTYHQIVKEVVGEGNTNFQMLGSPVSFSWPVAPAGQLSPQAYQFMSAAPTYSAVGDAADLSVSRLFDNYRMVLMHVGYKLSHEAMEQAREFSNRATELQNHLTELSGAMNSAYEVQKQNGGAIFNAQYPSITDWLNGPGQTWKERQKTLMAHVNELMAQQRALDSAQQSNILGDILKMTQSPEGHATGPLPHGWTRVPRSDGVLEWQPSFNIGTTGQDWRAELTNGTIGAKSITLSASKSSDAVKKSWAGANGSRTGIFWSAYANGSWSETNISKSDKTVKANISFKSSTVVPITPGAWYNGGFLRQLAHAGNDGTGYQILEPYTATEGEHALFGKNGICPTMVTGLVVVYKPSFEVTMKSSTYKEHERKINAGGGFRIGPFSFGGSGGHYEHDVRTTGNTTTFGGSSTSDDPIIIGYTVGFPGLDHP
ncbi:MAG: hypothetical protein QNK37_27625 [Acidobacteriota bacterium]|nr:hypothetical protein [Acidobacteriota bacterium]